MRAAAARASATLEFDPRELVVTTFGAKPPAHGPSRDILWSEVWDTQHPLKLGHPIRWVLRKTDAALRIRDLGREDGAPVSHPIEDIPLADLVGHGPIELASGRSHKCWVLVQPVPAYSQLAASGAKGWSPNLLGAATVSDASATRMFRRCLLGVLGTMALLFISTILNFTKSIKTYCTSQCILCFTLIQSSGNALS